MYFFETPLGLLTIKATPPNWQLKIGGRTMGTFKSLQRAVESVGSCRTGYGPWDHVCPTRRPLALSDWTRSIFK